ncbi:MAG: hypothetical protein ACTS2F_01780 [Thainema sp.]
MKSSLILFAKPLMRSQPVKACGVALFFAGLAFASPANAASYTIDFETDAAGNPIKVGNGKKSDGNGDLISDQWLDWGVNISAERNGSPEPLLLFNSNCFGESCTGDPDDDLATGEPFGTEPQGNVLIIQQKNDKLWDPNDDWRGGTISFDFMDGGVNLDSITLLDVDDDFGRNGVDSIMFTAYFTDGTTEEIDIFSLPNGPDGIVKQLSDVTGDNSLYEFSLGLSDVMKFDVTYPGSGAIASIKWDDEVTRDIPEPVSAVGLLAASAIGAGATLRQKRTRQS